ncbi:MAG TPA: hypothetical protein VFY39_00980, partial [Gammaproteobacteria bacterium]|nr:hypothetical protein [Gammaproteobacteria bacterium]
ALAGDESRARVQRLEDEAAIRDLHQRWLRKINAGERDAALGEAVRRIAADYAGKPDAIELAADGKRAAGRFSCVVGLEEALAKDSTLAQMAHAQGAGFVSRTEQRVLDVAYAKTAGAWAIASATFSRA